MSEIPGTGVSIEHEFGPGGQLTLTMYGPVILLSRFSNPSEVLFSFMMNLEALGLAVEAMDSMRTRVNANTGIFALTWTGIVANGPEDVRGVIERTSLALSIESDV